MMVRNVSNEHRTTRILLNQVHVVSAGAATATQNSGNGPDGAHPPITRSPMAQERGVCVNVSADNEHYPCGQAVRARGLEKSDFLRLSAAAASQ